MKDKLSLCLKNLISEVTEQMRADSAGPACNRSVRLSSAHTGNSNMLIKVLGNNVVLLHAMKAHGKVKVLLQSVLTSAPDCGGWSASSLQQLYPW
jgi:hypothetical protein